MAATNDPRKYWGVTRLCLLPGLDLVGQSGVAVEALVNGVPAIASDRGGLPETMGELMAELGLVQEPDRLRPRVQPGAGVQRRVTGGAGEDEGRDVDPGEVVVGHPVWRHAEIGEQRRRVVPVAVLVGLVDLRPQARTEGSEERIDRGARTVGRDGVLN